MQEGSLVNQQSESKSKIDLIRWISDTLKLNLLKVEQLGSGAVFCQLLDAIHPGHVPMNKVSWTARHDYEFIANFRVLQKAMHTLKITHPLPVDKLIRCKFVDNYDLAQWFYRYYAVQGGRAEKYDAMARRGGQQVKVNLDFTLNYKACTDDKENRDLIEYYSQQKQYITSQKKYQTQHKNRPSHFQVSNYKISLNENSARPFAPGTVSHLNSLKNYDKNILTLLQNQSLRVEEHPIYQSLEEANRQIYQQLADVVSIVSDPSLNDPDQIKKKVLEAIYSHPPISNQMVSMFDEQLANDQEVPQSTNQKNKNIFSLSSLGKPILEEGLVEEQSIHTAMEVEHFQA